MKRLARQVFSALTCVLILLMIVPANSAAGVYKPYFVDHVAKSSLFQEWAIHPQGVRNGDKTFIAYQGPGLDPRIIAFDHTAGRWSSTVRLGDNPLATDTHGAPAIFVDADGFIHVIYGGHTSVQKHARSRMPGDITSWIEIPNIPNGTYPQIIQHAPNDVEMFFRNGAMDWTSIRSTDGGKSWSNPRVVFDDNGAWGFYASFSAGKSGEVLATAVGLDWPLYLSEKSWARRNVYFMKRGADGIWRNCVEEPVTVPVTRIAADNQLLIFDSHGANANNPQAKVAPDGDICIGFSIGTGGGAGSYAHHFMRQEGSTWNDATISHTDHFFDTLTFRFDKAGNVHADTIEGGPPSRGTTDRQYTDDGGLLIERVSTDGAIWPETGTMLSPAVPHTRFHHPTVIAGGDEDGFLIFTEWMNGPHFFGLKLYMLAENGLVGAEFTPGSVRLAGSDRVKTAVKVSEHAFPLGSDVVVLASSATFADALTGGPLAATLGGPVLLTSKTVLQATTAAEIRRLKPKRIVILGGESALSAAVRTAAGKAAPSAAIERISGADRYETSARIARRLAAAGIRIDAAYIASATEFADSAAVSGWAGFRNRPVLLTGPGSLSAQADQAVRDLGIPRTIILGGERAVSSSTASRFPAPTRIAGRDRFATAVAIAEASIEDGMIADRFLVANGHNFPDSLTSGVLAARLRAPTILVSTDRLAPTSAQFIGSLQGTAIRGYVIGGTSAVSSKLETRIVTLVRP